MTEIKELIIPSTKFRGRNFFMLKKNKGYDNGSKTVKKLLQI